MKRARLGIAVLALAGCATDRTPRPATTVVAQVCNVDRLQNLVGRPATPGLVAEVRRKSGAATARRITPEMRVTMEYRTDRVNVWVGLKGEAQRINCG